MPFFFPFGGKRSLTVRCVTIIKSSGLRNSALTPGSDDGVGDRGMSDRDRGRSQQIYDQFRAAYGIPAKRGCAVIPCGNGECGCA
jgi:hypothetical protein